MGESVGGSKLKYFIVLIALFLSLRAIADDENLACDKVLASMNATYGDETIDLHYEGLGRDRKTVEFVGNEVTSNGLLHLIRKIGVGWSTSYRTTPYDPQGNPQWPIYLLGKKAAKVLGFSMKDIDGQGSSSFMTLPSLEYLKQIISNVNRLLPTQYQIHLNFYPDEPSPKKLTRYLQRYADSESLPMGDAQANVEIAIHDLSFHLLSMIIPNEVTAESRKIMRKILDFGDQLMVRFAKTPHQSAAAKLKTHFRLMAVKYIDEASSTTIDSLRRIAELPPRMRTPDEITRIFTEPLMLLLGHAEAHTMSLLWPPSFAEGHGEEFFRETSNYSGFVSIFQDAIGESRLLRSDQQDAAVYAELQAFAGTLEFRQFQAEFSAQWERSNPDFKTNRLPTLVELCLSMHKKRQAIIDALEALSAD